MAPKKCQRFLLTPSFATNHREPASVVQQGAAITNVELLEQTPMLSRCLISQPPSSVGGRLAGGRNLHRGRILDHPELRGYHLRPVQRRVNRLRRGLERLLTHKGRRSTSFCKR